MKLQRVKESYFTKKQAIEILTKIQHTHTITQRQLAGGFNLITIKNREVFNGSINYMIVKGGIKI